MKRIALILALFALLLTACAGRKPAVPAPTPVPREPVEPFTVVRHAEISVRDYGTIKLELDEGSAPITVADSTFLDGRYAAFGRVTEGMDVAEQIAWDAKPIDGNGSIPPGQQPVIESIVITD